MSKSLLLQVMPGDIRIAHRLTAVGTIANGINASGDIVGSYIDGTSLFGFVYRGGTYTTIDIIGIETEAYGINASGQVVGSYIEKTARAGFKRHGFFYIHGHYATLDHPSTTFWTDPRSINDAGLIVGGYSGAGSGGKGFLYINGLFVTIEYPSARGNDAIGINNSGQIVGNYSDSRDYTTKEKLKVSPGL
jgi:uncharacterized membrane protein